MMFATHLKCKQCNATQEFGPQYYCGRCLGPLEVAYDYETARAESARPGGGGPYSIWRYGALLPTPWSPAREPVDIGTGWTPLVRAERLGIELGFDDLWVKNDSVNPTFSFKDRNVAIALNMALEFGSDVFACASTGNLAGSVAGFAAKAGLESYVFVPADLEPAKLIGAAVYGATLVTVDGNYDDVNRLCIQVADEYGWAFANVNLRPFYSEGSKTVAFEIVEQLGWQAPDVIVAPMAGASLVTKIHKALKELVTLGWIDRAETRIMGAQATGCSPVVDAVRSGATEITPVIPDTIAKSIAIGRPADGYYALKAIRDTNGDAAVATDEEIVEGIHLLAQTEGIFTETAGGAVVAAARRLREEGSIRQGERTVLCITGNGLKTTEVLNQALLKKVHLDRASLSAFEKVVALPEFAAAV
jgi:threonine synthase